MFDSVQTLLAEHEQLQQQLADPAIHADAARAKKVNRRYAELSQIVTAHTRGSRLRKTWLRRASSPARTTPSPRRCRRSRRAWRPPRRSCVDC